MEVFIFVGVILMLVVVVIVQGLQIRKFTRIINDYQGKPKPIKINEPTQAELEAKLKAAYETKIGEATQTFGVDLQATSKQLSEQVSRLTTTVIEEELESYHKTLEEVRATAIKAMDEIHSAVESQRTELRQGMETDLAKEKEILVAKFESKMGDVVASYIAESLGSGVDLGAQMQFILASLEAHKEDIRKDLLNGV